MIKEEFNWVEFKEQVTVRQLANANIKPQYLELTERYIISATDNNFTFFTIILRDTNDSTDVDDFENNFKSSYNAQNAVPDVALKSDGSTYGLHVITESQSVAVLPSQRILSLCRPFTNGSNASMDVNGSSTPQNFVVGPGAGEIWYCYGVTIFMVDSGSTEYDDFGAIGGGINNGVQLIQNINGTEYEYGNFKNNQEIGNCFYRDIMFSSVTSEDSRGWFDEANLYKGTHEFKIPIELRGDDNDQLIFRIRDNITGLTEFTASAHFWRIVP